VFIDPLIDLGSAGVDQWPQRRRSPVGDDGHMIEIAVRTRRRGLLPAAGLFLLAPLFGEYLLGNLKFSELPLLPFLAVLYGAGALLIRELTRRAGLGAATMLTLGVAYALIEEGLVDQMLFNQNYFVGQAASSDTYLSALGIDAWLTIIVVAMHTIWSTYIPITIVESLVPDRRTTPWLGPIGTAVTVVVFLAGSAWLGWVVYSETQFFAKHVQLLVTLKLVVLLVAAAFVVPRRLASTPIDRPAPRPWLVGAFAFVSSSLFMLTESLPGWAEVAAALAIVAVFAVVVTKWSRRTGFGVRHHVALVAGGVFTYAWLGLVMVPESGPKSLLDHAGSVAIAAFAIALVLLALRRAGSSPVRSPLAGGEE
jgi:hypothetical protein